MYERRSRGDGDVEAGLAAQAAWLSYIGGYTHEDIAARLHLSRIKVTRLIAKAHQRGIVKVFVEGTSADCAALEEGLIQRYGLDLAVVAPALDDGPLPLAALGNAGARYLNGLLEGGGHPIIGVGHGRTLAAVVENLPRVRRDGTRFVSLLGGLIHNAQANPFDIIHRLCERTGSESYFMPAPFIADSGEDRDVLTAQRSLRPVFDLAMRADPCLVGIGEIGDNAFLRLTGMIRPEDFARLQEAGAVGEVLGQFVDEDGVPLPIDLNRRSIGLKLDDLKGKQVVAVCGGATKARAIDAVLRTGAITGLVTDEATARALTATGAGG
ncbi:MAG: sugar-binding transcriptional regulator [Geminicoccaceae bacterium]|nr:sugar-binding transcriptional regulator [Geminicoccaceae bacterium]